MEMTPEEEKFVDGKIESLREIRQRHLDTIEKITRSDANDRSLFDSTMLADISSSLLIMTSQLITIELVLLKILNQLEEWEDDKQDTAWRRFVRGDG